jgi:hypothetical protein
MTSRPRRSAVSILASSAAIAGAITLTGCGGTSSLGPVQPTNQPNQYVVTNRVYSHTVTWVQIKETALERGIEYCRSIGQHMEHPEIYSNHATGLQAQEATVAFSCADNRQPAQHDADGKTSQKN